MWVVTSTPLSLGVTVSVARAFEDTTTDIDIDEERHLMDYPVRLAEYRGSLYWSGNEGQDPDTKRPRGGTYGGPKRNGTWSAVVIDDVDMAHHQKMKVKLSSTKGTVSLARTDGLLFQTGSGSNDNEMEFEGVLNDVNLAFEWLTYDTIANENGPDAISIVVNDT